MINYRELPPDDYAVRQRLEMSGDLMPSPGSVDVLGESWVTEKTGEALRGMTPLWWGAGTAAIFGLLVWGRK